MCSRVSPHSSEVSCKTLEGVDGLKKLIYQVAHSMKDSSSSAFGSKLLCRMVSKDSWLVILYTCHLWSHLCRYMGP